MKFRLTAVVIVLVLATTVAVALFALLLAERNMKGVIGDQQYAVISSAAAFIDDRLEAKQRLMAAVAAGVPAQARSDPRLLQAYLESRRGLEGEFLNLSGFDKHGTLIATLVPVCTAIPPSGAGKQYFEATLAQKHGIISTPFKSRMSGDQSVLVTEPVFDDKGAILYVLGGSIDLGRSNFLRQIDALRPGKTGYIFIMTSTGILVDHPDRSRVLRHIDERPGINPATRKALAGFEGWTEARNKAGSPGIYSYKRLRSTDWIVGARYPTDEAFAPMTALQRHALVAAAVVAAFAGVFAWVLIYRLLAPLETLRSNVSAIRSQGAGIGILQVGRSDEIGELGRAFYELVAAREAAQEQLGASENRLQLITDNLPVLIAYVDREHVLRFANATVQRWFGVAPNALVGRSLRDAVGSAACLHITPHLERAFAGHPVTFQLKMPVAGSLRTLETSFVPDLQADGSVVGAYALTHDMTRIKDVESKLMQLARVDPLTGIANRRMFGETLHLALERSRRQQAPMALAYLDIDRFKSINDTFGHAVGDEVLKEFAQRLVAHVRATDTVARLSGDEFVIVLEQIGSEQEATTIAAKIIEAIRTPFSSSAGMLDVTASVGIALFGGDAQGETELLANADRALYQAKRNGRDAYAVHGARV